MPIPEWSVRVPLPVVLLFLSMPARATDLTWDGHYRARGLLYDSLSLSESNDQAEGTSNLVDHRLRLRPGWYMTDRVALFAQVDALDLEPWGGEPETWVDPVTGDETALAWSDTVVSPTYDDEALASNAIAVTRAWAEVYTDFGRLRFGRVPLHWGAGMLLNDGLAPNAEYGDTADRVQFTSRVGLLYLMAAWDVQYEGYLNAPDDMQTLNGAIAYLSETVNVGFYNRYRYQPAESFNAYTGDLWFEALLGPARVQGEVAAVFGGGDLETGANDIRIGAVGALLQGDLDLDRFGGGLEGGLATGDGDPDDDTIRTFTFDRDHNVSLLMFEEPLPTLEATSANETNAGRETDAVRTGEGIRNALYLRPHAFYRPIDPLTLDLAVFVAQAAKVEESEEDNKGYGLELDFSVHYTPYEHFIVQGMVGVLWPGRYYSDYEDDDLGSGFEDPALGGMLMGTVHF